MQNDLDKKYSLWRWGLFFGIFIWPFAGLFFLVANALVSAGGGTQARVADSIQTYYVPAVLIVEILAILIFFFAKSLFKSGKTQKAITILKIPFLCVLILVVFYFSISVLPFVL